jgi:hypothetical protein
MTEDPTDFQVVQALLKAKGLVLRVKRIGDDQGGITRLADQLEGLIQETLKIKPSEDCIAVLYDADESTEVKQQAHQKIQQICERYRQQVVLIVAKDEIESWLLADTGLCTWLEVRAKIEMERKSPVMYLSISSANKR